MTTSPCLIPRPSGVRRQASRPHRRTAQQRACRHLPMGRASRCHGPPWSPRAGHRPSAASSPPCSIPFLNAHSCEPRPARPRPRPPPDSNNRLDPSPYYPVFGRRMVMISYARRLPNLVNRCGKRVCAVSPWLRARISWALALGADGPRPRPSRATDETRSAVRTPSPDLHRFHDTRSSMKHMNLISI